MLRALRAVTEHMEENAAMWDLHRDLLARLDRGEPWPGEVIRDDPEWWTDLDEAA